MQRVAVDLESLYVIAQNAEKHNNILLFIMLQLNNVINELKR